MIVYLDTSAFLKLYLDEDGGDQTREAIDKAGVICTHLITYVEMRAALARAPQDAAHHRRGTDPVSRAI